jgi:hypothetical protein
MKKPLLFLLLLSSINIYGNISPEKNTIDSIVVNIGKKKKIVLWGETREDLKALEKYDLNRIVVQMNQDLEEMPTNVRRSFRQDFEGNSYTKETTRQREIEGLTSWQRLKRDTYINLSLGLNSARLLQRNNPSLNTSKISAELFRQNVFTSPNINLALLRQESFIRAGRKEIILRYGFDLSWYYVRSVSIKNTAYLLSLNSTDNTKFDTLAIYRPAKNGNYYTSENYLSSDTQKRAAQTTPNQSLFYVDFKVIPTINFYGRDNQRTFNIGLGAYLGTLLSGSRNFSEIKAINQLETKVAVKSKENPYRYGVILNIGHGIVNLFLEADIKNLFQNRQDRSNATQNLTTIGLRFGR